MTSSAELLRKYSDILSENPISMPGSPSMSGMSTSTNPVTPGTAPAVGMSQQAGQPPGGMNPGQAAMAAKQQQDQKTELQSQIKQTEQQLMDLRKKLSELN